MKIQPEPTKIAKLIFYMMRIPRPGHRSTVPNWFLIETTYGTLCMLVRVIFILFIFNMWNLELGSQGSPSDRGKWGGNSQYSGQKSLFIPPPQNSYPYFFPVFVVNFM